MEYEGSCPQEPATSRYPEPKEPPKSKPRYNIL
jgi:hypothetical protein